MLFRSAGAELIWIEQHLLIASLSHPQLIPIHLCAVWSSTSCVADRRFKLKLGPCEFVHLWLAHWGHKGKYLVAWLSVRFLTWMFWLVFYITLWQVKTYTDLEGRPLMATTHHVRTSNDSSSDIQTICFICTLSYQMRLLNNLTESCWHMSLYFL